jgi:hypothetical protein
MSGSQPGSRIGKLENNARDTGNATTSCEMADLIGKIDDDAL